jgi:hypothetical protein
MNVTAGMAIEIGRTATTFRSHNTRGNSE